MVDELRPLDGNILVVEFVKLKLGALEDKKDGGRKCHQPTNEPADDGPRAPQL